MAKRSSSSLAAPVIALLFRGDLNLAHGKPEEGLKAEDRLKDIQDAQPEGVTAQMVRDLVAKERGQLSVVQLMERANRHADLTTDPGRQAQPASRGCGSPSDAEAGPGPPCG